MIIFVVGAVLGAAGFLYFASRSGNTGRGGERKVAKIFERLGFEIMESILLETSPGRTTEIDLIALAPIGIFVVETKDRSGRFVGSKDDRQWKQYLGRSKVHTLYNPVMQNHGHMNAVRRVLPPEYTQAVISLVVFTGKADLETDARNVVKISNLSAFIHNYSLPLMSAVDVSHAKEKIQSVNKSGYFNNRKHVQDIKNRHGK